MIVYGSQTTHLKSLKPRKSSCPNCNNLNTIQFNFFSRHAHILWLPLFPVGKRGESECSHCKQVLTYYEMPKEWRSEYKSLKKETKTPWWKFSGLALFLFFLGYLAVEQRMDKINLDEYIVDPKAGDIYYFIQDDGFYSSFLIKEVFNDTIYAYWNQYYVENKSDLKSIDKEEKYSDEVYFLTRSAIDSLKSGGKLVRIIR